MKLYIADLSWSDTLRSKKRVLIVANSVDQAVEAILAKYRPVDEYHQFHHIENLTCIEQEVNEVFFANEYEYQKYCSVLKT